MRTASITWIIPLLANTSDLITVASLIFRLFPTLLIVISLPSNVLRLMGKTIALICADVILSPTITWYLKIRINLALFAVSNRPVRVLTPSFLKALSSGANTVNGPTFLRVLTRSATCKADASVWKLPLLVAVWTISNSCAKNVRWSLKFHERSLPSILLTL